MISLVASCYMCLTFSCSVVPSIEVQRSPLPWGNRISWPVIPPHLCWLLHLYTDSVPLSQPALPCNESRARRSFGLIYRLPVLFSASSKQALWDMPSKWSSNRSIPLTHASYSHHQRKSENFSGTVWSVLFMPVWFFMGVILVFLSGCLHHTV